MYLDPNNAGTFNLVNTLQENAEAARDYQLIETFKPVFSQDGNMFCFRYGELPNDCILGFGETPYAAMRDWINNFYNQKAITPTSRG